MRFDPSKLRDDLARDEGVVAVVYDDATGRPLRRGDTLRGHPTIGIGHALDVRPLTSQQIDAIYAGDVSPIEAEVYHRFPWLEDQPEPVQRGLMNMAFNLGPQGLASFLTFLGLVRTRHYAMAADDLRATKWYGQVGNRAKRIEQMIRDQEGA